MTNRVHTRHGQSLVEIMLAIMIFALSMTAISAMAIDASVTQRRDAERTKAIAIAQEGIEAARSIRDAAYSGLTAGSHGITISGNVWTLSGTSDTTDGFTRTVLVGTSTSNFSYVTSTVSWNFSPSLTESVSVTSLFTNWQKKTGGSWTTPIIASTTTLPGNISALAVAVQGNYLYVTAPYQGGGNSLFSFDVTNPQAPVLLDSIPVAGDGASIAVNGNYAYVGSASNQLEVQIFNITNPSNLSLVNNVELSGSQTVTGVAVTGTQLHIVRSRQGNQATYYIYNITNPLSVNLLGSTYLGNGGNDLDFRAGSPPFALFATADTSQEFKVVNFNNPASLAVGGGLNFVGTVAAQSIDASGTIAYVGQLNNLSGNEFFVVNDANATAPSQLGSLAIGADVNHIKVYNNYAFLATASSTAEFMVVDVTNAAAPTIVKKINLSATATGLALSADGSTAYVTTADPNHGLIIIQAQ